ncbi:carboxyl transferase domain-containing protein [Saccharopolyspora shandongensis]|uniref:carboxyl transferase domain-containing protein n=1 Tax=Saccharopolyspora shandongensis TaxID=418495 RepID=UPI0033D10106
MTATAAPRLIAERAPDPRLPVARLARLLDRDSATALHPPGDCGVIAVAGRIDGARVIAYCTDATKMGGALGADGARRIVDAIDRAVRDRCPVVGLWHSGGAKLAEGVESMDGVGQMFAAMIRASGRVPQISVVLGPAALGASAVFAWPEAEVAVMGTEAAVGILHRKRLSAVDDEDMRLALRAELVDEHERLAGGVGRALDIGVVDEVIDPADTRRRVAAALAEAAAGRGHHGNIPL